LHLRHAVDGGDNEERRLPAAGHHVDIGRVQIGVAVHRRNGIGTNRGGRQINHSFARGQYLGAVGHMRAGKIPLPPKPMLGLGIS
jgi:hypothetical protein